MPGFLYGYDIFKKILNWKLTKKQEGTKMSTIIYACEMIRDEVVLALKNTGCNTPVIWVDNQLHTYPEKLRAYLQSAYRSN